MKGVPNYNYDKVRFDLMTSKYVAIALAAEILNMLRSETAQFPKMPWRSFKRDDQI